MNQPRLLRLTAISSLLWALLLGVGACSPFEPRAGVNDAGNVSDLLTVSRSGDADLVLSPSDKVVGTLRSQGTASNPLILLDSVRPGAHIFHEQPELTLKTTTIVSLNPADGSVRWAGQTRGSTRSTTAQTGDTWPSYSTRTNFPGATAPNPWITASRPSA